MSTKSVIISLLGVIVIGGAMYFSMGHSSNKIIMEDSSSIRTSKESTSLAEGKGVALEPGKNASNDEIIDYIVDGQTNNETKAAEASLETSSSVEAEPTIVTNF